MILQNACLQEVRMATLGLPYHYLVGNHDLYCFSRDEIHQKYPNMQTKTFYSMSLKQQKFRVIFLDTYDISCISPTSEANKQRALKYLFDNSDAQSTIHVHIVTERIPQEILNLHALSQFGKTNEGRK